MPVAGDFRQFDGHHTGLAPGALQRGRIVSLGARGRSADSQLKGVGKPPDEDFSGDTVRLVVDSTGLLPPTPDRIPVYPGRREQGIATVVGACPGDRGNKPFPCG